MVLIQFSCFSLVSIMLISDIFSFQNLDTKESGLNFSGEICYNFRIRTCTTTWKFWVLSTYDHLVYSSDYREKQTLARNQRFYGNSNPFSIKSPIACVKKIQYFLFKISLPQASKKKETYFTAIRRSWSLTL